MAAALVFRLHDRGPELLREVLLERGWEEFNRREHEEEDWNLYWRGSAFRTSEYHHLLPWQRLNHHPKTVGITRKVAADACCADEMQKGLDVLRTPEPSMCLSCDFQTQEHKAASRVDSDDTNIRSKVFFLWSDSNFRVFGRTVWHAT